MPQDIPWDASETLAFSPETLAALNAPPVFTLRAPTAREKRFRTRLLNEAMVATHSLESIRAETLRGLRQLWGEENFEKHHGRLTTYWTRLDDFRSQQKADPEIEWDFDTAEEEAIFSLLREVGRNWPPLGRMNADNAEWQALFPAATVAVTVTDWTGIDVKRTLDRGFLDLNCVDEIETVLIDLAEQAGLKGAARSAPMLELYAACEARFSLREEEAKNSESPSPSSEAQPPSRTGGTARKPKSKSPASKGSKATPSGA